MSEIFKQNSINLVLSTLAIICAYYIDLGGTLFWFGGLLLVPAIAVWYQFKFALGNFLLRIIITVLPWLSLCLIGLLWASNIKHDGQRNMNMFFFEMPLYSVAFGVFVVTVAFFFKQSRVQC